jgi:hypothetical protein
MKMKTIAILTIFLCFSLSVWTFQSFAQCTPLGADECPDLENNGEICPDTLEIGFINQLYSEAITILAPSEDTSGIQLHHLTLITIDNLPTGMTWESNAPDDEFFPGIYYCVLMEGPPTVADTFPLKIIVDIYVDVFGFPVYAGQIVDSTSVALIIVDNTGLVEGEDAAFYIRGNYPNPFTSWTSIKYYAEVPGPVEFEVYSIMGEMVDSKSANALKGENYFHYMGEQLAPGTYFYLLKSGEKSVAGKTIRGK